MTVEMLLPADVRDVYLAGFKDYGKQLGKSENVVFFCTTRADRCSFDSCHRLMRCTSAIKDNQQWPGHRHRHRLRMAALRTSLSALWPKGIQGIRLARTKNAFNESLVIR